MTLQIRSKNPKRDWPSDFEYENGNYFCNCVTCHKEFVGNKHRFVCRVCDNSMLKKVLAKVPFVWQVHGFKTLPWYNVELDTILGYAFNTHAAGWLWFQFRWNTTPVNK